MNGRILIVEDDAVHRQLLERHLSRTGHEVVAVDRAELALARVARTAPDLIIADVRLPGMDGYGLLARLHEAAAALDVILVTAYGDVQDVIDAMKGGAYDFLPKPLDLERLDEAVQRCLQERTQLRDARLSGPPSPQLDGIVGRDPSMIEVYKIVGAVAATRTPVLIRGETGTGKELIARAIHRNSENASEPFLAVNCAAMPESLLESELFGHVRGAFTGALNDRKGRFELAGRGTIFLDEIGDTSPAFQTELLRVLQHREFYPVGGERPRRTDARVLSATHRPIEQLITGGRFREDLYFRLRIVEITLPPLRERTGDIPLLTRHILARVSRELGKDVRIVSDEVMAALLRYDWPGNVRELENALTRAVVLAKGPAISLQHLALGIPTPAQDGRSDTLDDMERVHVQDVLTRSGGNKSRAAERLGISRPRLDRIIRRHHLVV